MTEAGEVAGAAGAPRVRLDSLVPVEGDFGAGSSSASLLALVNSRPVGEIIDADDPAEYLVHLLGQDAVVGAVYGNALDRHEERSWFAWDSVVVLVRWQGVWHPLAFPYRYVEVHPHYWEESPAWRPFMLHDAVLRPAVHPSADLAVVTQAVCDADVDEGWAIAWLDMMISLVDPGQVTVRVPALPKDHDGPFSRIQCDVAEVDPALLRVEDITPAMQMRRDVDANGQRTTAPVDLATFGEDWRERVQPRRVVGAAMLASGVMRTNAAWHRRQSEGDGAGEAVVEDADWPSPVVDFVRSLTLAEWGHMDDPAQLLSVLAEEHWLVHFQPFDPHIPFPGGAADWVGYQGRFARYGDGARVSAGHFIIHAVVVADGDWYALRMGGRTGWSWRMPSQRPCLLLDALAAPEAVPYPAFPEGTLALAECLAEEAPERLEALLRGEQHERPRSIGPVDDAAVRALVSGWPPFHRLRLLLELSEAVDGSRQMVESMLALRFPGVRQVLAAGAFRDFFDDPDVDF